MLQCTSLHCSTVISSLQKRGRKRLISLSWKSGICQARGRGGRDSSKLDTFSPSPPPPPKLSYHLHLQAPVTTHGPNIGQTLVDMPPFLDVPQLRPPVQWRRGTLWKLAARIPDILFQRIGCWKVAKLCSILVEHFCTEEYCIVILLCYGLFHYTAAVLWENFSTQSLYSALPVYCRVLQCTTVWCTLSV